MNPETALQLQFILPLTASVIPLLEKAFSLRHIRRRTRRRGEAAPAGETGTGEVGAGNSSAGDVRAGGATLFAVLVGLLFPAGLIPVLYRAVSGGNEISVVLGGWNRIIGIAYLCEGLSLSGSALVWVVAIPCALFGLGRREYPPAFWFLFLVTVSAMQAALFSADLFNLFVNLEILAMGTYILIAWKQNRRSLTAGFSYLLSSALAMSLYLFGVFVIYRYTGSLAMERIGEALRGVRGAGGAAGAGGVFAVFSGGWAVPAAVGLIVSALGLRAAFIPFHGWLPEAHARASHAVSGFLSGAVIKAGLFSILRILVLAGSGSFLGIFVWVGSLTAFVGVLFALCQSDSKRLLAWHSISQVGFILASLGCGTAAGIVAGVLHCVSHGIFKNLLFLSLGMMTDAAGERNVYRLSGLLKRFPVPAVLYLVGALSITGIPPFNGYASKDLVLRAVKEWAHSASAGWGTATGAITGAAMPNPGDIVLFLLIASSVGTAASFTKLTLPLFRRRPLEVVSVTDTGKPEDGTGGAPVSGSGLAALAGPLILALLCLGTGVFSSRVSAAAAGLLAPGWEGTGTVFLWKDELKSLVIAAAGLCIGLFAVTAGGRKILHAGERMNTGLSGLLSFVVLGAAAFSLWGIRLWFLYGGV